MAAAHHATPKACTHADCSKLSEVIPRETRTKQHLSKIGGDENKQPPAHLLGLVNVIRLPNAESLRPEAVYWIDKGRFNGFETNGTHCDDETTNPHQHEY
jgi:hypothetical protein